MTIQRKLLWLTLFAIAMAQVEASLVIHLRSVYYPQNPLAIFPLSVISHRDLAIELIRELATLVMLVSVAILAEKGFGRIFAAFVYLFGLWDLFYYIWLKVLIGWPVSWLEWDVLFLIPWPWFGPWIAPALIALLFVIWGGWILVKKPEVWFSRLAAMFFIVGSLIALASFLLPAVPLIPEGEEAFHGYRPGNFLWLVYFTGLLLMAVGLWRVATDNCAE